MQCEKLQRELSAYVDGELDAASSRGIERHLDQCDACRKMLADFREVDALVRGLPRFVAGPDFAVQLLARVSECRAPIAHGPSHRSLFSLAMRFLSHFVDLLEARESPNTKTLDEFGDFPPSSLGYIYFQLLDQTGRR